MAAETVDAEMQDLFFPRRTRARDGTSGAPAWTEAVRSSARMAGRPDPMTELFARQQKDLKQALERAESAERIKRNFLAHMSHEFRTPLNAIIGFSSLIRSGACGDPERIQDYAAAIETAGQQLHTMLSGILELAALDAERTAFAEDAIDVGVTLGLSVQGLASEAAAGGVAVATDIPARMPRFRGDRRRLRQVFDQILSNAVKFTPRGGRVQVRAALGAELMIEIADTGIGMAEGDVAKALGAFEGGDGLRAHAHGGAGIGLPLAAKLVELHGGRLSVESTPGIGTTVKIALPQDRLLGDSEGF